MGHLVGNASARKKNRSPIMKVRNSVLNLGGVVLLFAVLVVAQNSQPNHQHYESTPEATKPSASGALAPRLQNLGKHAFPVSCKGEGVQAFFNQGVNLSYGFNHAEAGRAFREVARRAPDCAMAYWGQALVLGPNINSPMDPAQEANAYSLVQKAASLKAEANARERDYIDALAARYSGKAEDRKARDRAYADAMRKLSQKYPDDLDAATLFVESMMDVRPWDYWTRDGRAQPGTDEIVSTLDRVIARNPHHPGALHLTIHVWEPTDTPERAEAAADRLLTLVPGAGHLVHMPGHIYQRVGRYQDVVRANDLAMLADEDYITQCRAQGIYPLGYYPHNIHFKWFGATMAGQRDVALQAARKTAESIPTEAFKEAPFLQGFLVVPYYAMVRFGRWEDVLREPPPRHDSLFTRGVRHYARGAAFTGLGRLADAERELAQLNKIVAEPALIKVPASFSQNNAQQILRIAPEVLAGEIAAKRRDYETAIRHLDRAVRLQDALVYTEPDDWHYPVRHSLGAVLLEAGRPEEAEVVYWEDLRRNPENGWSLAGLAQSLKAQHRNEEAAHIEQRFRAAWPHADFTAISSRR